MGIEQSVDNCCQNASAKFYDENEKSLMDDIRSDGFCHREFKCDVCSKGLTIQTEYLGEQYDLEWDTYYK